MTFEKIKKGNINAPVGKMLVGFDGYIDRIVKLKKNQTEPQLYFDSIGEFTGHLQQYQNRSVDIALKKVVEKTGGNGPIMAESLACKGVDVCCIGAFGSSDIHPLFEPLSKKCRLVSLAEPALTLALEFQDGKIMLADTGVLDAITWERICSVFGREAFLQTLEEADIIGFTNWSGLTKSNDILAGLANSINTNLAQKKMLFIDIADPSCKSQEQFNEFFKLMEKLSGYYKILFGLNTKEALMVYNRLFARGENNLNDSMLPAMLQKLPCFEIVVHNADWAFVINKDQYYRKIKGTGIKNPVILTGAGDNFNAGYCLGKLWGLESGLCAWLGYISAQLYVKTGISAGLAEISALEGCTPYNEEE